MKALVTLAALLLVACATATSGEEARPLTPAELRAAVGDGVICLQAREEGACSVVIAPIEITDTSMRLEARDVFPFESYIQTVAPLIAGEDWVAAYHPLFAELSGQRAAGNYDLIRTVEYREGVYDSASGSWCTAPRAEPRVFANAQMAFAAEPSTSTAGDAPLARETVRRLGDFVEDLLSSDAVGARMSAAEVEGFREELRGVQVSCTTYFGVVRDGRVELRASGESWPGEVAEMGRAARVHPANAELRFAAR